MNLSPSLSAEKRKKERDQGSSNGVVFQGLRWEQRCVVGGWGVRPVACISGQIVYNHIKCDVTSKW